MLIKQLTDPFGDSLRATDAQIRGAERRIAAILDEEIAAFVRENTVSDIEQQVEQNDLTPILAAAALLGDRIAGRMADIQRIAAIDTHDRLLGETDRDFDPFTATASRAIRNTRQELARGFGTRQRQAIRRAAAVGRRNRESPRQIAQRIQASIGLTPQLLGYVENFENQLRRGEIDLALQRSRRDRRFDSSLEAALTGQRALSEEKIKRMTLRYKERLLITRRDFVAIDQASLAVNRGEFLAFDQAVSREEIEPFRIRQRWAIRGDGKERSSHLPMSGQVQPYGVPFISGAGVRLRYPHDPLAPASETVRCRCRVTRFILP